MELMQKNTTTALAGEIEKVVINGDLSELKPEQRVAYYNRVCESTGLNPLTRPFDYIKLNGKLTLYARRDAADQLRRINGVSIDAIDKDMEGDFFIVTVKGHDKSGRTDMEIGAVNKKDMQGNFGNALMKCVTKAKRRLTLSLCGLGWLDETEVETIPDAAEVQVNDNGEIIESAKAAQPASKPKSQPQAQPQPAPQQAQPAKPQFVEEDFLRQWQAISGSSCTKEAAEAETNSKGESYGTLTTYTLFQMLNMMNKRLNTAEPAQQAEYKRKISAINEIFNCRKAALTIKPVEDDPFTEVTDADFIPLEA